MKLKSMMKRFANLLAVFILSVNCISAQNLTRWVNPFIGTGAVQSSLSGNNYPGATVPFGMVQLSPDTREAPDWAQASGYDYNDSIIYGFSHTRLSGTGASDFIDILLFPTMSDKRKSSFTHQNEQARPGYYQVLLTDEKIQAELTASVHVGVHRYIYSDGGQLKLWLDLDHSANKESWNRRIIQSQIRVVSPTVVEGYRVITGWAKLRKIYFHLEFSQPILSSQLHDGNRRYENTPVINGTELCGLFCFDKKWNNELICKVALSPVSIENARLNMAAEVPGWNFEHIASAAEASWEKELKKVHPEIDLVTTPDGSLVAMAHANNCTSDLNAWVGIFREFAESFGMKVDMNQLFGTLYNKALEGDADCGGLLSYGYLSGENMTGVMEGRPLFVRSPKSCFNLANFMRANLFTALGALKVGMDILLKEEHVEIDTMLGHGGLFKTKGVGQKILAAAINAPVSVMETAGEGGPWGMALLASYMIHKEEKESLQDYLSGKVFAGSTGTSMDPDAKDVEGFEVFIERYKKGIAIEQSAVDHLI